MVLTSSKTAPSRRCHRSYFKSTLGLGLAGRNLRSQRGPRSDASFLKTSVDPSAYTNCTDAEHLEYSVGFPTNVRRIPRCRVSQTALKPERVDNCDGKRVPPNFQGTTSNTVLRGTSMNVSITSSLYMLGGNTIVRELNHSTFSPSWSISCSYSLAGTSDHCRSTFAIC